jgi:hypothetical protein
LAIKGELEIATPPNIGLPKVGLLFSALDQKHDVSG